jgi:uncharacterized protein YndB with AHSA1/START domain
MANFTLRALVNAPIDTVFEVLTDHRAYPGFTPLRSAELEREGDPAPNGVGAIRALRLVGPPIREQVTEYVKPTRFVYTMLSGAPVRDHVGTVDLIQEGNGTRINYHVQTFPKLPGPLAPVAVAVTRLTIIQLFNGIKKRSEQLAAAPA